MHQRCLHHFSVGTIINPVNTLHDHPTFPSTRYTALQARGNVSRRTSLQLNLTLSVTRSFSNTTRTETALQLLRKVTLSAPSLSSGFILQSLNSLFKCDKQCILSAIRKCKARQFGVTTKWVCDSAVEDRNHVGCYTVSISRYERANSHRALYTQWRGNDRHAQQQYSLHEFVATNERTARFGLIFMDPSSCSQSRGQ
jgi:hypothetical protein